MDKLSGRGVVCALGQRRRTEGAQQRPNRRVLPKVSCHPGRLWPQAAKQSKHPQLAERHRQRPQDLHDCVLRISMASASRAGLRGAEDGTRSVLSRSFERLRVESGGIMGEEHTVANKPNQKEKKDNVIGSSALDCILFPTPALSLLRLYWMPQAIPPLLYGDFHPHKSKPQTSHRPLTDLSQTSPSRRCASELPANRRFHAL